MKSFTTLAVVASYAVAVNAWGYNTTSIATSTSTSTYCPPTILPNSTYSPIPPPVTYSPIPPPVSYPTIVPPPETLSTTYVAPTPYPTGGSPAPPATGVLPTGTGGSPTNIPVGPTIPPFTGAASTNSAFGGLAALGLVMAYFI